MAYKVQDQGVALHGFTELQQALARIESKSDFGLEYELQRRLRVVGEKVAQDAPRFVTHRTHRHGNPGNPRLEDSVKVSVGVRAASVYSTAEHGGVQNVGGGPHAGWSARGPHVRKDRASEWVNKAVRENREFVKEEMDGLLAWVVEEFERGA